MISALYILAIIALHAIGAVFFAPGQLILSILTAIFLFLLWLVSPGRDVGRVFVGFNRFALLFVGFLVLFFVFYLSRGLAIYERLSAGVCVGSGYLLFYAIGFRVSRWLGFEGAATGSGKDRGIGDLIASSSSFWPLHRNTEEDGRAEELGFRAGRRVAGLRRRVRRLLG